MDRWYHEAIQGQCRRMATRMTRYVLKDTGSEPIRSDLT